MQFEYIAKRIQELAKDMKDAKEFEDEQAFENDLRVLRKVIQTLAEKVRQEREDGAFFEGELEDKKEVKQNPCVHVKKEDSGDCVSAFKERRKKRLDTRCVDAFKKRRQDRMDAKDDDGRWITTENGHKVHLNEEGVPDKGNPFRCSADGRKRS